MKRALVILLLLISRFSPVVAQSSNTDSMTLANQLYQDGSWAEAAQIYQQLVNSGIQNSDLDYNLGNAYFKMGELGEAIFYYKQAQSLAPRDADIAANLDLARSQTMDKYDRGTGNVAVDLANLTRSWLTENELGAAALLFWFGFALLWIARRFNGGGTRPILSYGLALVTVLLFGSGLLFGSRLIADRVQTEGVIVADEIDVTSAPGAGAIIEFTLHSGAEVNVMEQRSGWARLALPGEHLQGWVPQDTIQIPQT